MSWSVKVRMTLSAHIAPKANFCFHRTAFGRR